MLDGTIIDWLKFVGPAAAALWAAWTYHKRVKLERARWMKELYEKFYEQPQLKDVRELLDSGDPRKISELVRNEEASFTDYLNFFEFLAYLEESKQVNKNDMLGLFEYYLRNLKANREVIDYIENSTKGFEKLRKLLQARLPA